jgi:peptide/nickel transport system permease protein
MRSSMGDQAPAEKGLAEVPAPTRGGQGSLVVQTLKDRPSALLGFVIVLAFVLMAIFAPLLAPYSDTEKSGPVFSPPSAQHWLGTDDGGVDVLSELIYGGRTSLIVGFTAALVAMFIGGGVGTIAGYYGGGTDVTLMRITDYFLVIPDLVLMIVVASVWGQSLSHVIVVIGVLLWTTTARIVRAQVKSIRERVYVKRARSLGASNRRIVFQHVLPQVAPLLIANTVLTIAVAIFDESALAFLGVGVPGVSWGTMLERAFDRAAMTFPAWWAFIPPGVCIALVIIGCYLMGQALEDAMNPRLKVAHLSIKGWRYRPSDNRGDHEAAVTR